MISLAWLLAPYVEALGYVLTVIGMVTVALLFCLEAMVGGYHKQLRKFQSVRAGKGMSL